jgi:hypothetical protein
VGVPIPRIVVYGCEEFMDLEGRDRGAGLLLNPKELDAE